MFRKGFNLRAEYARLLSDVSLHAMSYRETMKCLANVVSLTEERELSARTAKSLGRLQQHGVFNLTPEHVSEIMPNNTIIAPGYWRLLVFHKELFKLHHTRLSDSLAEVANYDHNYIVGDFEAALECIDRVESIIGVSLWSTRSRIIALSKCGRHAEVQQYFDEITRQAVDPLTPFFFRCFLLISSSPVLHTKKIIYAHIRELQTAGYSEVSDLLKIMFSAHDERTVTGALSVDVIQNYPILDQYLLLRCALASNLANFVHSGKVRTKEREMMTFLNSLQPDQADWMQGQALIKNYEEGNYSGCVLNFNNLFAEKQVPYCNIALAVKASVICNREISCATGSPLAEISASLASLIRMDANPGIAMDTIRGHVIQAFYTLSGVELQTLVIQVMPNQFTEEQRKYRATRLVESRKTTSRWIAVLAAGGDALLKHGYICSEADLPKYRILKGSVRHDVSSKNFESAYETVGLYSELAPLERDRYELFSSVHIAAGNIQGLIDDCAKAITVNPYSYSSFPISLLASYIEKRGAGSDIQSIIVMHSYVKNVDRSKEYILNESYEEFFIAKGLIRPSEVRLIDVGNADWYRTLLLDVSTVETMDFLGSFSSSADVKSERVKILDMLLEDGLVSAERYRREVDEIASQIVVESGVAELNIHKIDVSDSEIRKKVTEDVASLIAVYRAAADGKADDFLKMNPGSPAAVVAGDRNTTALKILAVVREVFLYDEGFGLDKNLSAEIRHGFFSNLMRSKPDMHNLLLEIGDGGAYKSSDHWKSANGFLAEGVLISINKDLEWFTSEFNSLVADAEEWMKVTVDTSDENRVFNYGMYRSEVAVLRALIDSGVDVERTIDYCIDSLWGTTERHLESMRERINVDLRKRIDYAFGELALRLDDSRGNAALVEMRSAVTSARNEIKEDIGTVAAWFKRGGIAEGRRSLVDLVAISMEVFKQVRPNKVEWIFNAGDGTELVFINGRSVKAFVVALINLYENSVRHGGACDITSVEINATRVEEVWSIDVTNPINDVVAERLRSGGLDLAREKIQSESYSNLVRTEGGTGLRKVLSLLSGINERFSLDLDLIGNQFKASIRYV